MVEPVSTSVTVLTRALGPLAQWRARRALRVAYAPEWSDARIRVTNGSRFVARDIEVHVTRWFSPAVGDTRGAGGCPLRWTRLRAYRADIPPRGSSRTVDFLYFAGEPDPLTSDRELDRTHPPDTARLCCVDADTNVPFLANGADAEAEPAQFELVVYGGGKPISKWTVAVFYAGGAPFSAERDGHHPIEEAVRVVFRQRPIARR